MTLIVTAITNHGIVHASDSNLTADEGRVLAGRGTKVFRLGFTEAAVSVAGAFSVARERMDKWMPDAITAYAAQGAPTLEGFARHLAARLDAEMTDDEQEDGSLIHIAGYSGEGGVHPELWFVRNVERIDALTGEYDGRSPNFGVTEDFWGRDYPASGGNWPDDGYQIYFNGAPEGRISYLGVHKKLEEFFTGVWGHPTWEFRPPRSLDEWAAIIELEVRAISALFITSDYAAPAIGGDPQIEAIQPPAGFAGL